MQKSLLVIDNQPQTISYYDNKKFRKHIKFLLTAAKQRV